MLITTECIVLRRLEYGDSSIISTVLTPDEGKISLMAKGARKPKSRFAGLFEAGNILQIVCYLKPNRDLQIIKEASYAEKSFQLRDSIEKMAMVSAAMELVNQLIHDREVNEAIYQTSRRFLVWMNEQKEVQRSAFPMLQFRLASALGLGLQLDEVSGPLTHSASTSEAGSRSQHPNQFQFLDPASGLLTSERSNQTVLALSPVQREFLVHLIHGNGGQALAIPFTGSELKSLIQHLDHYLGYHLDGLKPRKSERIFEQYLL